MRARRPLDMGDIFAIMNVERRCDKRLAQLVNYISKKKPSPAGVAVSAFYDDRDRIGPDR